MADVEDPGAPPPEAADGFRGFFGLWPRIPETVADEGRAAPPPFGPGAAFLAGFRRAERRVPRIA